MAQVTPSRSVRRSRLAPRATPARRCALRPRARSPRQRRARARARRRSRSRPRWARAARAARRAARARARARPCAGRRARRRGRGGAAGQRFSSIRQVGSGASSSPASWRSASQRDQRVGERRDRRGVGHGRLRVRDPQLERPVAEVRAQLPPPRPRLRHGAGGRAPGERGGELVPARDRRRDALAREQLGDLRPHGRQAGVLARVERRVGGERRELRAGASAARCRRRACGRAPPTATCT